MADRSREREWRARLKRFEASGLSVRAFCEYEDLAEQTFYSWRKRLAASGRTDEVAFVEIAQPSPSPAVLELVLPSGITLRVHAGCDADTLARVLDLVNAR